MYKKILVPTDGTPLSEGVIAAAIELARVIRGSQILGLSVIVPISASPFEGMSPATAKEHEKHMDSHANRYVGLLKTAADAAGVPCEVLVTKGASPAEEIVRVAKDYQCDCIFMASHGRKGLNRLFLGSETQKVLAQATVPVLVHK
ncbi:MAG: universal stress protein [Burkholderiaceae bacterium]|nr:universal stress protein [Burkholderiaceae bacterium]